MAFIQQTSLLKESTGSVIEFGETQVFIGKEVGFTHVGAHKDIRSVSGPNIDRFYQARYPANIDDVPEFIADSVNDSKLRPVQTFFVGSTEINSHQGHSVAIGSNKIAIGAPLDFRNTSGDKRGAVYVVDPNYENASNPIVDGSEDPIGIGYKSFIKLTKPDNFSIASFGQVVACGCGRLAVGDPGDNEASNGSTINNGAIYLYDISSTSGNGARLIRKIMLNELPFGGGGLSSGGELFNPRFFGSSIAIGNGRIVAGSYNNSVVSTNQGAVYIFDLDGRPIRRIIPIDSTLGDKFGYSVAIGSGRIVVGAPGDDDNGSNSGSAYIFDLAGNQIAKIKPPTGQTNALFGRSVAVGNQRIIVGAPRESFNAGQGGGSSYTGNGAAYLFGMSGRYIKRIVAGDVTIPSWDQSSQGEFGSSVAIGDSQIIIGQPWRSNIAADATLVTGTTRIGGVFRVDLNGNTYNGTSNNVASSSTRLFPRASNLGIDQQNNDTLGISVTVGNGICCIGGSGMSNFVSDGSGSSYNQELLDANQKVAGATGDGGTRTLPMTNGKVIIGRSSGLGGRYLSTQFLGLADLISTRYRDFFDVLDER